MLAPPIRSSLLGVDFRVRTCLPLISGVFPVFFLLPLGDPCSTPEWRLVFSSSELRLPSFQKFPSSCLAATAPFFLRATPCRITPFAYTHCYRMPLSGNEALPFGKTVLLHGFFTARRPLFSELGTFCLFVPAVLACP